MSTESHTFMELLQWCYAYEREREIFINDYGYTTQDDLNNLHRHILMLAKRLITETVVP